MKMPEAPVFVKIESYKEVLDIIGLVKSRLQEARDILERINDLKKQEDAAVDTWRAALEEIERRVDKIDESLFQPEGI